jgi:hypothetical protein
MSMIVLGLAEELKTHRIAANALWPKTTIATAAVQNLLGGDFLVQRSRTPEIVAEAAYHIVQRPSYECSGNFFIDEDVLRERASLTFPGMPSTRSKINARPLSVSLLNLLFGTHLRENKHILDGWLICEQHAQPVDSKANAGSRWHTIFQRTQESHNQ